MADYTETATLTDTKLGDRWVGVTTIGPVTVNAATPDNALTRIRMTFKLGRDTFVLDSVGDGGITISDADTWEATIPARDDFLTIPGKWDWDMEFWQEGYDNPWTLYKGTIQVYADV